MNPDQLAGLEEERRFLLRSLADLEREFEAGDVDEVDYRELRDGYTVRAAATLRAIENGRASLPTRTSVNWPRRVGVGAVVVALVAVIWWALAASTAQRLPGQVATGVDPRDDRSQLVAEARAAQLTNPGAAADIYGLVLAEYPDDVEALAYRGWTLALSTTTIDDPELAGATLSEGIESLARAVEVDPDYPDSFCFLGIIQARFRNQPDEARPFLERCLAANPPGDIRGLVQGLIDSLPPASADSGG